MTDEQVLIELARLMGWKIAPADESETYADRQAFFADTANYPIFNAVLGFVWFDFASKEKHWNPFEDWTAAIELVRSDGVDADALLDAVDAMATASGYSCSAAGWLLDEATPHDLALCVARAAGIEVDE